MSFFQGGTIKFLVNLLDIDKAKESQRLIAEEVHDTVAEHVMAGIEVISGKRGSQYFGVGMMPTGSLTNTKLIEKPISSASLSGTTRST